MQPIANYFKHPASLFDALVVHYGQWLPDSMYIKLRYRFHMGRRLKLNHPQTFQEKLQWLKLHDQNPEYTIMVDKVKVKDYVSHKVGCEYVVPLLGVWDKPEEIEWDSLPKQFVLKTNHSGGNSGVVICRDKANLDKEEAVTKLCNSLQSDIYKSYREWPYKNVEKKVFAEKFIEDESGELRDYKFFCFNGKVKALFIATDRQTLGKELKFDFFDANYNHLPLRQGHPNSITPPQKPDSFEDMKRIAEILSKDIPHVRVDFYEVNGKAFFGEMTFCHFAAMVPFEPEEWDYKFGEWLDLRNVYKP